MVYRPNIDDSLCFVLLPLRAPFLGYFDQIITPAAKEVGLTAVKASDIYGTRPVISDIWDHIWRAKAVVAIVSGRNPNVNYELGICHTLGIPTVLLSEKKTDVPFDYQHRRYIAYATANAGWQQTLMEDLVKTLRVAVLPSNPADELQWPYDTEKLVNNAVVEGLASSRESRDILLNGVSLVRSGVAAAFGPDGTGLAFNTKFSGAAFAYDGSRIANSIGSGNPLQLQGIEAMRRVASEMLTRVGDHTKTAMLLGSELVLRGEEQLRNGQPLKGLLEGMDKAVEAAAAFVLTQAEAMSNADVRDVALTASRDVDLAEYVSVAFSKVGSDGIVTIEETSDDGYSLEIQEGLHFATGFLSRSFVTDKDRQECVLNDPYILLYEGRISRMADLLPILEQVAKSGRSLLIIAGDVTDEALATLLVNCQRGLIKVCAVKSPGLGDRMRSTLEDIGVATGGHAFLQELGVPLSSVKASSLGTAKYVAVTSNSTLLVGGAGKEDEINRLVLHLKSRISATQSVYDQEKLRERLAMITSGIATLRIGGRSDSDRARSKYSAVSAMHASQTAHENGIVPGGGVTLLRAAQRIAALAQKTPAQQAGSSVVREALEAPIRELLRNAKVADPSETLSRILSSGEPNLGFNAKTAMVENLFQAGVKDSAKAVKESILVAMAHSRQVLGIGAWALDSERETGV
jgi:chaperonin GroEL